MKKSDKRRSGADVLLLLYYQVTSKNLTLFEQKSRRKRKLYG